MRLTRGTTTAALIGAGMVLTACGGAANKKPATGGDAQVSGKPVAPAPKEPALTPVAAPSGLFAVARVTSPAAVLDRGSALAGNLPWRPMVEARAGKLLEVIDMEGTFEAAAMLNPASKSQMPDVLAVVSAPLKSRERALEFAREQRVPLTKTPLGHEVDVPGKNRCVITRALGKAPARLVCSDSRADLEALVPYVTRGLPTEDLGREDVVVEARIGPFRDRYAPILRQARLFAVPFLVGRAGIENAALEEAFTGIVEGVLDEGITLVDDADSVRFTTSISDQGDLSLGLDFGFRSEGAWSTKTLMGYRTLQGRPPPAMFELPLDVTSGAYARGADGAPLTKVKERLLDLANGALGTQKVPERTRIAALRKLRELQLSVASVSGSGTDVAGKSWTVVGTKQPVAKVKGALEGLNMLYRDRRVKLALAGGEMKTVRYLPTWTRTRIYARGLPPGVTAYKLALPAATVAMLDKMKKDPQAASALPPFVADGGLLEDLKDPLTIAVVPGKDGWTWIGMGSDPKVLALKLAITVGGKDADQLGARPGFEAVKGQKAVMAGFTTLRALTDTAAMAIGDGTMKDIDRVMNTLPGRGRTPILTAMTIHDQERRLQLRLTVPKAALTDGIAAGIGWFAMGGDASTKPPEKPAP